MPSRPPQLKPPATAHFKREKRTPWANWYGLRIWRRRAAAQLQSEPRCMACLRLGRITLARVADHIVPHRGDWQAFAEGELQSLCRPCHDQKFADELAERRRKPRRIKGSTRDGSPLDCNSHWHRGDCRNEIAS